MCVNCGRVAMSECTGCHKVNYCSTFCQRKVRLTWTILWSKVQFFKKLKSPFQECRRNTKDVANVVNPSYCFKSYPFFFVCLFWGWIFLLSFIKSMTIWNIKNEASVCLFFFHCRTGRIINTPAVSLQGALLFRRKSQSQPWTWTKWNEVAASPQSVWRREHWGHQTGSPYVDKEEIFFLNTYCGTYYESFPSDRHDLL